MNRFAEAAVMEAGFTECGSLSPRELRFHSEVRKICEGNSCRNYGASWACPPAVGTLEDCRARVERYGNMLLFTKKYAMESSFDFEAMGEGLQDFKKAVDRLHELVAPRLPDHLLLSNEGCGRCRKCTYPDAPCRFPDRLYHSLEGYGFVVNDLARAAHVRYNNGPNTVTFFGALLWNGEA